MKKTRIIFSDTWLTMTTAQIQDCLQQTLDDFVNGEDEVINIQMVTNDSGSSRFWIYVRYMDNES